MKTANYKIVRQNNEGIVFETIMDGVTLIRQSSYDKNKPKELVFPDRIMKYTIGKDGNGMVWVYNQKFVNGPGGVIIADGPKTAVLSEGADVTVPVSWLND